MDPATIKLLKVVELKEVLKSVGLTTKGRKAELQERLLQHFAAEERGEKTPSPELLATGETSSEQVTNETESKENTQIDGEFSQEESIEPEKQDEKPIEQSTEIIEESYEIIEQPEIDVVREEMQADAEKNIPKEPKHKHKWDQGDEGPIEIDDMQDVSQPNEVIDLDAVEDQVIPVEESLVIKDAEVSPNLCDLGFAPPDEEEEIEPYDQQVISPPAYDDLDEEEKMIQPWN